MKAPVFLARYLKSQGLERAFGLPGGESIPLMEALRQADIPFILGHHESSTGYMAGTTGFLTGVPGLCIVTRGPRSGEHGERRGHGPPGPAASHRDLRATSNLPG